MEPWGIPVALENQCSFPKFSMKTWFISYNLEMMLGALVKVRALPEANNHKLPKQIMISCISEK